MRRSGGNGTGGTLDAAFGSNLNQALVMRFDLSEIVPGSLTSARLDLTAASAISGTHTFMVYALEQDNAALELGRIDGPIRDAPGLSFDGNSGTLGINNSFTTTSHPDNPGVLTLGQVSTRDRRAAGETDQSHQSESRGIPQSGGLLSRRRLGGRGHADPAAGQ